MAHQVAKRQVIVQYGPYGSQCPENYSMKLEENETIKEVIIRHGFIVDAIGFVVAKPCGNTITKMFGVEHMETTNGRTINVLLPQSRYTPISAHLDMDLTDREGMYVTSSVSHLHSQLMALLLDSLEGTTTISSPLESSSRRIADALKYADEVIGYCHYPEKCNDHIISVYG
ncbi:Nitrite reductase [Bienertia sinuspersici]